MDESQRALIEGHLEEKGIKPGYKYYKAVIVLECHEADDPDCVEAFKAYVQALAEIVGQTLYNVSITLPAEEGA